MADFAHHCSACGEMHGGPGGDSEAVRIAKIQADRDIEVARLARSEARQEIEAQIEQTEIVADAEVEQTAIQAEAVIEVGEIPEPPAEPEPDPEPVPIVVSNDEDEAEEVPAPGDHGREPPAADRGMWAGYATS